MLFAADLTWLIHSISRRKWTIPSHFYSLSQFASFHLPFLCSSYVPGRLSDNSYEATGWRRLWTEKYLSLTGNRTSIPQPPNPSPVAIPTWEASQTTLQMVNALFLTSDSFRTLVLSAHSLFQSVVSTLYLVFILKMEALCSYGKFLPIYHLTQHNISEDSNLHCSRREVVYSRCNQTAAREPHAALSKL
jgi:hypothetical protein